MCRPCFTALFAFIAFTQSSASQLEPRSRPGPFTIAQVWTLNATYRDPQHGVTFQYPSVWEKETQFGYEGSALKDLSSKPIAGFGYEEGGFPRDRIIGPYSSTNLEGFGIVYFAIKAASADQCERLAASLSTDAKRRTIAIAGRSFRVFEVGEAGMSQGFYGDLYATFINQICYLFETDVVSASAAVADDVSALTPGQSHSIDANLLRIMKSVRIAPTK